MEGAEWICEEPKAEVSFYGQSLEALRSSGYAPHQPGLTPLSLSFSLELIILFMIRFISFNHIQKQMLQETAPTSHYKLTEIEIRHKLPKEFNLVLKTKEILSFSLLLDIKTSIVISCPL